VPKQLFSGKVQTYVPDIAASNSKNIGASPGSSDVPSGLLRLLNIPSHDAGVGAEPDQGSRLRTADSSRATCDKNYPVIYLFRKREICVSVLRVQLTDMKTTRKESKAETHRSFRLEKTY
jgi:hypothetical protein